MQRYFLDTFRSLTVKIFAFDPQTLVWYFKRQNRFSNLTCGSHCLMIPVEGSDIALSLFSSCTCASPERADIEQWLFLLLCVYISVGSDLVKPRPLSESRLFLGTAFRLNSDPCVVLSIFTHDQLPKYYPARASGVNQC